MTSNTFKSTIEANVYRDLTSKECIERIINENVPYLVTSPALDQHIGEMMISEANGQVRRAENGDHIIQDIRVYGDAMQYDRNEERPHLEGYNSDGEYVRVWYDNENHDGEVEQVLPPIQNFYTRYIYLEEISTMEQIIIRFESDREITLTKEEIKNRILEVELNKLKQLIRTTDDIKVIKSAIVEPINKDGIIL